MKKTTKRVRDGAYANDIKQMRNPVIWATIIIIILTVLTMMFIISDTYKMDEKYQEYQKIATVANEEFDASQRQKLVEWLPNVGDEDLGEDGFIKMHDPPRTLAKVFQDDWLTMLLVVIGVFSVVFSVLYWLHYETCFYFADLPFRSFWGWFVLTTCFVIWPFFAVSRILLWRFKRHRKDEAMRNAVNLPEIMPLFKRDDFIGFYRDRLPFYNRLKCAKTKLAKSEDNVRYLGERLESISKELREAQIAVNRDLAEVNALRTQESTEVAGRQYEQQAAHDFAEIKAMRGVRQIYVDDHNNLIITVRAAYEYTGLAYDAGDFRIQISDSCLTARQTRSVGNRYSYGESFCFGGNRDTINDYVAEGRIVEAVELAIESLNHINGEDVLIFLQRSKVISN